MEKCFMCSKRFNSLVFVTVSAKHVSFCNCEDLLNGLVDYSDALEKLENFLMKLRNYKKYIFPQRPSFFDMKQ
jgi:hypothetical protein